jgi:hypothetical protein
MEDDFLNIDEFLPIGGTVEEKKPTVFKKDEEFDDSFLDEKTETKKEDEKKEEPSENFDDIIKKVETSEDEPDKPKGLSKTFEKLFEKGVLIPFDDDKSIEEYTAKDWQELIEVNLEEKTKDIQSKVQNEFLMSLPEELQSAAQYVMSGGRDLKNLFKVLSDTTEIIDLNPNVEEDQEIILRQFLSATNFGTGDEINEQIDSWKEAGQLEKWAKKHKPKLDKMYSDVVNQKVQQQEELKKQQEERKEVYMDNVYKTLKKGELNGIKLDAKRQNFLWQEMTQTKYESMNGRPTNLLGHLLEKYQFSDEPRYDLITEALWLLQDPEGYKEEVSKNKVKETTAQTVRTLKTEQARKTASTVEEKEEDVRRKIARPQKNIFARN